MKLYTKILVICLFLINLESFAQHSKWILGSSISDSSGVLNTPSTNILNFFEVDMTNANYNATQRTLGQSVKDIFSIGVNEAINNGVDKDGNVSFYVFVNTIDPFAALAIDDIYFVYKNPSTGLDEVFHKITTDGQGANSVRNIELVKDDSKEGRYFVIYKNSATNSRSVNDIFYVTVDMNTLSVSNPTPLASINLNEGMAISNKNCEGKRWLLFSRSDLNKYEIFKAEISEGTIKQPISAYVNTNFERVGGGQGDFDISPNNKTLAHANFSSNESIAEEVFLFDFDIESGNVSNYRYITNTAGNAITLCFSPDSKRIFIGHGGATGLPVGLSNALISSTNSTIGLANRVLWNFTQTPFMELTSRGELFIAENRYMDKIFKIDNPNAPAQNNNIAIISTNHYGLNVGAGNGLPDQINGTDLICTKEPILDNALVLNGCTDYIEIPHNNLLDYDGNYTIEAWVKPNCADGNRIVIAKQWCSGNEYSYYLSINEGNLLWNYDDDGDCTPTSSFQTTVALIPNDRFTHVAVVHNSNSINLYVNGENIIAQYITGGDNNFIKNTSEPLRIGAYKGIAGNYGNYFSGMIDELRLWNRSLSQTEIQTGMSKLLNGDENGLIVYHDMEEPGAGATLKLINKSSHGSIFDGTTKGFTNLTPYIGNEEEYLKTEKLITETSIDTCAEGITLSLPTYDYKMVNWNTGQTSPSINVTQSGLYIATSETEMCRIFIDSIQLNLGQSVNTDLSYSICPSQSITINNYNYNQAGSYTQTLQTSEGCDSILNITITESEAGFENLYGNANNNQFQKILKIQDKYYVTGLNNNKATLSIIDASGQLEKTIELTDNTQLLDLIKTKSDNLLLVGIKGTGNSTQSIIAVFNTTSQLFDSVKEYGFSPSTREFPINLYLNPNPSNPQFPYYVNGMEVYTGATIDKFFILTLDENGNIGEKINLNPNNIDHELGRGISYNGDNGDMLHYGGIFDGGSFGALITSDNRGNTKNGLQLNDAVQFRACYSRKLSNNTIVHILGGDDASSGRIDLIKYDNSRIVYSYSIPELTTVTEMFSSSTPEEFYCIGMSNFNGISKSVVIKFRDNGSSLTILSSKILNSGNFEIGRGSGNFDNGIFMYCDSRKSSTNTFGDNDGFIFVGCLDDVICSEEIVNLSLVATTMAFSTLSTTVESRENNFTPQNITNVSIEYNLKDACGCTDTLYTSLPYSICPNESITINNIVYNQAGSYIQNLKTSEGCDSILTITIITKQAKEGYLEITFCDGESVEVNGQTFSQSMITTQLLFTSEGCDSILTIVAIANPKSEEVIAFSLCSVDNINVNGTIYNQAGQYTQSFTNSNGCDSTLVINISEGEELVNYSFEDCNAMTPQNSMTYVEFNADYTPTIECGIVSVKNVYRENPAMNKHSCTQGVDGSITMCVSALNSCTYDATNNAAIVIEVSVTPDPGSEIQLNCLRFFEKAPPTFAWIAGASGVNNYPTRFGLRVLKNGVEIYRNSDLPTSLDWKEEVFNLGGDVDFTVDDKADFRFELLPYCLIGNGATVAAWDIDDLSIHATCDPIGNRIIAGNISMNIGNSLKGVAVTRTSTTNGISNISVTDEAGNYYYERGKTEMSYQLNANKNDDTSNGLSTLDLILMQRHILGIEKFDEKYKHIAADVNKSNSITVTDMVEIRKIILGLRSKFKHNESWRFLDKVHFFSNPYKWNVKDYIDINPSNINVMNADLLGIKIGDIDGDASFNRNSELIKLRMNTVFDKKTGYTTYEFSPEEDISCFGLQLQMDLHQNRLIEYQSDFFNDKNGIISLLNNSLLISANDASLTHISKGQILFKLIVESENGNILRINNESFISEIYDNNLRPRKIELNTPVENSSQNLSVLVSPNPSSDKFIFTVYSAIIQNINLKIYDTSSKMVHSKNINLSIGENKFELDGKSEFQNSGLYIYSFETNEYQTKGRLILIK